MRQGNVSFPVGEVVRIIGLVAQPAYNGCTGIVVAHLTESSRHVPLPLSSEELMIRNRKGHAHFRLRVSIQGLDREPTELALKPTNLVWPESPLIPPCFLQLIGGMRRSELTQVRPPPTRKIRRSERKRSQQPARRFAASRDMCPRLATVRDKGGCLRPA